MHQITRLVNQWHANRLASVPLVKRYRAPVAPLACKYTALDIERLVEMDKAHEDVRGPAIIHLFKRAFLSFGDIRYERLAKLSSSHLYNLRKSAGYQRLRVSFTKTRPVCNSIGVRKAPCPNGRAGFVRIDSVHQGDEDAVKGVYHITCVDSIFYHQYFNPWLNLHRPCMFATSKVNAKGKVVKVYKHADVKIPLEALVKLAELGLVSFKTETMLVDLLAQAKQ